MRRAWRFVRHDISLWLALFGLFSLAAVYGAGSLQNQTDAPMAILWMTVVPLLINFLAVVLFDAAASGKELGLGEVLGCMAERGGPFIGYIILTGIVLFGAAGAIQAAVYILLGDAEYGIPAGWLIGFLVAMTLRVRYCFVPFLTVLHRAQEVRTSPAGEARPGILASAPNFLRPWPLVASDRLGESCRWRLAPYVILTELGALPTLLVPPEFILPALVLGQLVMLTARAVLFEYFLALRPKYGLAGGEAAAGSGSPQTPGTPESRTKV